MKVKAVVTPDDAGEEEGREPLVLMAPDFAEGFGEASPEEEGHASAEEPDDGLIRVENEVCGDEKIESQSRAKDDNDEEK